MKTLKRHIAVIICLFGLFGGRLNAADNILPNISPEQKAMMEGALTSLGLLDEYQNYVDNFSKLMNLANLENLPIGISRTMSNVNYTVAISGLVDKGDYADLTVYGRIITSHDTLMFGAQGIKFSYGGDFIGDVKLMLLADMTVPLWGGAELILHGGFDKESGRGIEQTYITMGCCSANRPNVLFDFLTKFNLSGLAHVKNNPELCKMLKSPYLGLMYYKLLN